MPHSWYVFRHSTSSCLAIEQTNRLILGPRRGLLNECWASVLNLGSIHFRKLYAPPETAGKFYNLQRQLQLFQCSNFEA